MQKKITKDAAVAEYHQIRKYVFDTIIRSGREPKRLASIRELASLFSVSTATIQRALKELVADGYITARTGVGLFTNPERIWLPQGISAIGVLAADGRQIYFESFLWNALAAVGKAVTANRDLLFNINLFSSGTRVEDEVNGSCAGMIWLGPDFAPSRSAEEFAASLRVPVVTVNDPRPGRSCVMFDEESEGYEVGRRLIAEGRFAPVVVAKNEKRRELAGLRRAFSEAGVVFPEKFLIPSFTGAAERLGMILELCGVPCAIYAVGSALSVIEEVVLRSGIDLEERCRLVAESTGWNPAFTGWRIEQDFEGLAELAVGQLRSEIAGGPPAVRKLARPIVSVPRA